MWFGPTVIVAVAAVVAGAVAAVSGFGIGSVMTPLLMIWMPTSEAVAVVAIPHAVATTIRWVRLRKDVHRQTFREFGLASAIGGLAGAALQSRLHSGVLTLVLAALLMAAGVSELLQRRVPFPERPVWRIGGGALSGFFGGLVGNQGGIRAAALLKFHLRPQQIVATATASALLVDAARIPIYLVSAGSIIAESAGLWLTIAAGVALGTFIGVPILSRLPERVYRRLVGGLLLALGLSLIAVAAAAR